MYCPSNTTVNFCKRTSMNKRTIIFIAIIVVLLNQACGIRIEAVNNLENTGTIHSAENTPLIIGSVKSYISIYEGENVTINCDVKTNPTPSKAWYKDVTRLNFEDNVCTTNPRITLDGRYNLVLHDARTDDNGNYLCGIRNSKGIATKSSFITVLTDNSTEWLSGSEIIKPIPLKNNPEYTYISSVWLTAILVVFVVIVLIVFIIVKIHQRRTKNVSRYSLQISPNERVNEIQQNEFKNKNDHVKHWVTLDVEEDEDGFLRSIESHSNHNSIIKQGVNENLLSSERHNLQSTSTNLFDCNCVHPSSGALINRSTSPCF